MVWKRLAALPFALALIGAVDPRTVNGDYPPTSFGASTAVRVIFAMTQAELDSICGAAEPPGVRGGCAGHDAFGKLIVVPHPRFADAPTFHLVVDHELAHVNGWSERHEK